MFGSILGAVAAPLVGNLVGGLIGGGGATSAGQTAAGGAAQAQQTIQQNLANMTPYYTPYTDLGKQGVSNLSSLLNTGYLTNQFSNADLNAQLAPNYAFMLGQGQQANLMGSNATGGAIGGNSQTALQQYTQNYAANAYQNAFNNYQTQRGNIYNTLSGIANIGQQGVSGLGNLSTGTAQAVGQLQTGAANAIAAGQVGAANAYSGAVQNMGNTALLGSLLNSNQGQNANNTSYFGGSGGSFYAQPDSSGTASIASDFYGSGYNPGAGWSA
jgi:hypothetical protein